VFASQPRHVGLDGALADVEAVGEFLVGQAEAGTPMLAVKIRTPTQTRSNVAWFIQVETPAART
jgi:hypothetical protein